MKRALVLLLLAGLFASAADARELQLFYEGSVPEGGWVRYRLGGVEQGVNHLYQLGFALEYDADLFEIQDVQEKPFFLIHHHPDSLSVEYLPGRVEVFVGFDAPVTLDGNAELFGVSSALLDQLYEGEKLRIRILGLEPGQPPMWIDDPQNPDDIRVAVQNRVIVGDSGITCLPGDALGDGEIDAGDSGTVLRIVTDLIPAPAVEVRCGSDINQDGNIFAGDAVLILRRAAGFVDPLPRIAVDPRVELVPTDSGARVRIERAAFAHGATLRVRAVGALALREVSTHASALDARRIADDEAVLALADVSPLTDDVLEFEIEAEGVGRIVIDQLSLYGAGGDALFEQGEPLVLDVTGPPVMSRVALTNSPNPFNPATTFYMDLPREGRARLELYDMRGRRLATLLDETRPAGRSEFRYDARSLPSGVYFARLESEAGASVRRITLLK